MNKYAVLTLIFWVLGSPVQAAPLPIVEFSRHFEGVRAYSVVPDNPYVTSAFFRHLNAKEQAVDNKMRKSGLKKTTVSLSKQEKLKLITFADDGSRGHYLIQDGQVEAYVLSDFFDFNSYLNSASFLGIKSLPTFQPSFVDQISISEKATLEFHRKIHNGYTEMYCLLTWHEEQGKLTYLILDAFYPSSMHTFFEEKIAENVKYFSEDLD